MDKRVRFLFIAGSILVIIAVFAVNILIKRYEKETDLPVISQDRKREVEAPLQKPESFWLSPQESEEELPLAKGSPLIN